MEKDRKEIVNKLNWWWANSKQVQEVSNSWKALEVTSLRREEDTDHYIARVEKKLGHELKAGCVSLCLANLERFEEFEMKEEEYVNLVLELIADSEKDKLWVFNDFNK